MLQTATDLFMHANQCIYILVVKEKNNHYCYIIHEVFSTNQVLATCVLTTRIRRVESTIECKLIIPRANKSNLFPLF